MSVVQERSDYLVFSFERSYKSLEENREVRRGVVDEETVLRKSSPTSNQPMEWTPPRCALLRHSSAMLGVPKEKKGFRNRIDLFDIRMVSQLGDKFPDSTLSILASTASNSAPKAIHSSSILGLHSWKRRHTDAM